MLAGGQVTDRWPVRPGHVPRRRSRDTARPTSPRCRRSTRGWPSCPTTSVRDTSSVRFAVCGAAPVSRELLRRSRVPVRLPDHRGLRAVRGHLRLDRQPARTGCASPAPSAWPLPGQTGGHDAARRIARCPPGEPGEVVIQGANVMRGYLNRPEETAEAARRRLAAYRRRRRARRGRLPDPRRPDQGHDHPRRREHLPQGDRVGRSASHDAVARGRRRRRAARGVRRGPGRLRRRATRTPRSPPRSCGASAGATSPRSSCRWRSMSSTELPKNAVGKIDKPALRKALQIQTRLSAQTPVPSRSLAKETIMGFTKPDLPDVDPETFLQQAAHGADAGSSPCTGSSTGSASPRMVHTIYIVKLLFFYALGGVLVATVTSRPAAVLARLGVVEPADRLPEGGPVDGAAGDDRRRRVVGPAGRQDQADDRRHPVLGPAGHHPAAAVEVGAVHRR